MRKTTAQLIRIAKKHRKFDVFACQSFVSMVQYNVKFEGMNFKCCIFCNVPFVYSKKEYGRPLFCSVSVNKLQKRYLL